MKTKQLILFLSLTLISISCCKIKYALHPNSSDLQGDYKYDGKYTGIDTLIRIDGYYSGWGSIMFFKNGEVGCDVLTWNRINDDMSDWGSYYIKGDTIKAELILDFQIKCSGVRFNYEEWYRIIDSVTLIRFFYKALDDSVGTFKNDTLNFVQSEFLMKPENQEKIKKQNWLRDLRRNWKDGYFPEDQK
jgi:hypothetical protein